MASWKRFAHHWPFVASFGDSFAVIEQAVEQTVALPVICVHTNRYVYGYGVNGLKARSSRTNSRVTGDLRANKYMCVWQWRQCAECSLITRTGYRLQDFAWSSMAQPFFAWAGIQSAGAWVPETPGFESWHKRNRLISIRNHFPLPLCNLNQTTKYRWLSAWLQYLQCVSNGDTAVLH